MKMDELEKNAIQFMATFIDVLTLSKGILNPLNVYLAFGLLNV